jgi:DNA repair protein RecN (Recombination protein N)
VTHIPDFDDGARHRVRRRGLGSRRELGGAWHRHALWKGAAPAVPGTVWRGRALFHGDTIPIMLERLCVRGLGIIDEVELEFGKGFGVLTGETGAGKSLLVESLKLLSGQRAQSDMVRTGDDRLRVEAWFSRSDHELLQQLLAELGVVGDELLVLRRELSSGGRSRCWVNDTPVTAAALQRIAPYLLSIHGQHEQHGLADNTVQRRIVDDYGGLSETLERVRSSYADWAEASAQVDRLRQAQSRRRDRLDTISFQVVEIDSAELRPGEDRELVERRQLLRHAVRISELSSNMLSRLADQEGAAVEAMAQAERDIENMVECGLELDGISDRLVEARVQVEEVVREMRDLVAGVGEDPAELESVESRLHRLDQLMLKYGSPIEEVIEHRDALCEERDELIQVEDRLESAEAAARDALGEYDRVAGELDRARAIAAGSLVEDIQEVLGRLNMGGTRLAFEWQPRFDERSPLMREGRAVAFDANGVEECELLIAANPGEEPRPMARIASGGELSRLHLALRTVLLGRLDGRCLTLLFDEVDSGLGGATAAALADLLADLAAENQVLVVTHLPQVAARAGSHFQVEKVLERDRAVTRATRLDSGEREIELARMLAGDELTESARAHARSLLGAD